MLFGRKGAGRSRSLEVIRQDAKNAIPLKDNVAIEGLFQEVISQHALAETGVESLLGWMVLSAAELQFACSRTLVPWFLEHYPKSLFPVRVLYGCSLAETNDPDGGTEHARQYLRDIRDRQFLDRLNEDPFLQRGVGHAFLVMTAVYTHLGARSYSERILSFAGKLDVTEDFKQQYETEQQRLADELKVDYNRRLDGVWEEFFHQKGAQWIQKLLDWCDKKKCPLMAKRVDLLHGNFKFNPDFTVDGDEMFMLVYNLQTEGDGAWLLR